MQRLEATEEHVLILSEDWRPPVHEQQRSNKNGQRHPCADLISQVQIHAKVGKDL